MDPDRDSKLQILGWREWLSLPELGVKHIKAKVDTGARTSALHGFSQKTFRERGVLMVRFQIHPLQRRSDVTQECVAEVIDKRTVSDSGGHRETRLVIATRVQLGELNWPIEMTLTQRDSMRFRMLLGRTALSGRYLVDAEQSYLVGTAPSRLAE